MSSKKNNKLASILIGPVLVGGGILALWENEGRFNYYEAAKNTVIIHSPSEHSGEPVSFTSNLDTSIPIAGEYIEQFVSYHRIRRKAQIYSWDESTDSDGNTTWRKGWYSSLDSNHRNSDLKQQLSSKKLYPQRYSLGGMEISPQRIHFADEEKAVSVDALTLTDKGRSLGLSQQTNYLYLGKGKADNLGDERVSYDGIPNAAVASYFGVVSGARGIGRQFEISTSIISGIIANDGILHHLVNGDRETALATIKADFTRVVWYTRIGGSVAIVFGIYVFLSSFMSLLYRIPLLGGLVETGVILVSLVLGIPIALITILAGLIFHNPFTVALPLVIVIAGIVYFMRRSRATKKNAQKILSSRLSSQATSPPVSKSRTTRLPEGTAGMAPASIAAQQSEATGSHASTPAAAMKSGYNPVEQTFAHLATMALAEGKLDKKENKMLVDWGKENGVTKDRMKALFAQAKKGELNTHPANRQDLELITCMALIDGELSKDEWSLLVKFASKMGLSAYDVNSIISDIESDTLATT